MTRPLTYYAQLISEISTLVTDAEDQLLNSERRERQFQEMESLLRDAAQKACTGLKNFAGDQASLADGDVRQFRLSFQREQEAIAGWIPRLRRNGVSCAGLADLLPYDLLPPEYLPSALG